MPSPAAKSIAVRSLAAANLLILSLAIGAAGCAGQPKSAANTGKHNYAFWPLPPDEPKVQFLVAYNTSDDIKTRKGGFTELVYGSEPEQILSVAKPYGIAMWNGRIYITDVRGRGVIVLDLRKEQTRVMGATGTGAIQKGVDIAIAADGTKYVLDQGQGAIVVFTPDEKYAATLLLSEISPLGLCVHDDLIYVTDAKAQDVKVLDRGTGRIIRAFGGPGGEDGKFIKPLSVATDAHGNVYVTDTVKARVQKFDPDGKLLLAFGEAGDRPGNFFRPKHMGVASDGSVFVVDAGYNNVQAFDDQGKVMGFFGSAGEHPGAMDLPAGLEVHESDLDLFAKYVHPAFQAEHLILVTNQFGNQKVCVYAVGRLKPGKTVADIATGRADVHAGMTTTQPTTRKSFTTEPTAPAGETAPAAGTAPRP